MRDRPKAVDQTRATRTRPCHSLETRPFDPVADAAL